MIQGWEYPTEPKLKELLSLVRGEEAEGVHGLIDSALIQPLRDFFDRPRKNFRGQLVEFGFLLSGSAEMSEHKKALCLQCSKILEELHAGSLVVDDIQDGSQIRRGKGALHVNYGVPIALNAGNWLYFWPFEKIRELGVEPSVELKLYRICHRALLKAHFGQALDVGVQMDSLPQDKAYAVSLSSIELKTGALMSLAMGMGAVLGGASDERLDLLEQFGRDFGIALQMFDDVGNLTSNDKKLEDLRLKRPSWIWAFIAKTVSAEGYAKFLEALNALPNEEPLVSWLDNNRIQKSAHHEGYKFIQNKMTVLQSKMQPSELKVLDELFVLIERLAKSYG